jgi:hypothetical protein
MSTDPIPPQRAQRDTDIFEGRRLPGSSAGPRASRPPWHRTAWLVKRAGRPRSGRVLLPGTRCGGDLNLCGEFSCRRLRTRRRRYQMRLTHLEPQQRVGEAG